MAMWMSGYQQLTFAMQFDKLVNVTNLSETNSACPHHPKTTLESKENTKVIVFLATAWQTVTAEVNGQTRVCFRKHGNVRYDWLQGLSITRVSAFPNVP